MMDVEDEFPKCANAVRQAADALSTLQTENEKLRAELEQVKRERDAAIKDLNIVQDCRVCKKHQSMVYSKSRQV